MIDPVSAFGIATAAFNTIKKGFEVGRDIESMYGDMSKWMGAVSDINEAERQSKNPPIFKKIFTGSSIEQEALNAFAYKKKAQKMESELRSWINLTHGPKAWDELLQMQAKIRKQRKEMIYKQQEKRKKLLEYTFVSLVCLLGVYLFYIFFMYLLEVKSLRSHDCAMFSIEASEKYYFICVNEGPEIAETVRELDFKHLEETTIEEE